MSLKKQTIEEGILTKLRDLYPHGHPDFIPMTLEEIKLHSAKNKDYTLGGDPLGNFRRVSATLSQYIKISPTMVALIYAQKQLDAAWWMLSQGYEGDIEGVDKRLEDVSVYVKLARILHRET